MYCNLLLFIKFPVSIITTAYILQIIYLSQSPLYRFYTYSSLICYCFSCNLFILSFFLFYKLQKSQFIMRDIVRDILSSYLLSSLVYKGRKVALYGGAYAPSYLSSCLFRWPLPLLPTSHSPPTGH